VEVQNTAIRATRNYTSTSFLVSLISLPKKWFSCHPQTPKLKLITTDGKYKTIGLIYIYVHVRIMDTR